MLAQGSCVRTPRWRGSGSRSYHLSEAQVAAATRGRRLVAGVAVSAPASHYTPRDRCAPSPHLRMRAREPGRRGAGRARTSQGRDRHCLITHCLLPGPHSVLYLSALRDSIAAR